MITQLAWDHVPAHGSSRPTGGQRRRSSPTRPDSDLRSGDARLTAGGRRRHLRHRRPRVAGRSIDRPEGWPDVWGTRTTGSTPDSRSRPRRPSACRAGTHSARAATFTPLAHRLEPVPTTDRGLVWISDVLATTQESATAALNTFVHHPVTMIIGGQDRGQPIDDLAASVLRGAAAGSVQVITMGETGPRFAADLGRRRRANVHTVADTRRGGGPGRRDLRRSRGAVLLSPAAPSYDQFHDFEAKSAALRDLVAGL